MNITADTFDILTYGEAMALFVANESGALSTVTSFNRAVAGAELNVATGFARLGFRSAYLSRVGDDAFGHGIIAALAKEGIDDSYVTIDKRYATGMMLKARTEDGSDPAIEYFRQGSAASHLSVKDFSATDARKTRAVHMTGIAPALSATVRELAFHIAKTMRENNKFISFDPNLRPQLWSSEQEMAACMNELATYADVVLPGIKEGRILTGYHDPESIARFYLDNGTKIVVIKQGTEGAYYCCADGSSGQVPAVCVAKVVDTVGAGDGFAVGVISALLENLPVEKAVARGCAVGARVVQYPGDSDGLPTRAELEAMLTPQH